MKNKAALIILDGWGIGDGSSADGISQANTPYFDELMTSRPNARLKTFGEHVGLPAGQMGNSEVGHLNIGAGRVVYQDFAKINKSVERDEVKNIPVLKKAFVQARASRLHIMGLVSEGGVHSHQNHAAHLCQLAKSAGVEDVFVHAFTDGRDTAPKKAIEYLDKFQKSINGTNAKLATIIGRFYSMDRDNRWERIKKAYDLLVHGVGVSAKDYPTAIQAQFDQDITDEFIEPIVLDSNGKIQSGDVVLCFNYRTDRCRQITTALTQSDLEQHKMRTIPNLHYYTMTRYDAGFSGVGVLFEKDDLSQTLGEVVSDAGLSQLRIAETEKYPHVTFFFSGGREAPFKKESRIVVNSPKVTTYDLQPEMSIAEVTEKVCGFMKTDQPNFVCLNFANPDMVGHTGVVPAIIKALEETDSSLQTVVETGQKLGYQFIIIADHGNVDVMFGEDGKPHTAHTTNLVPVVVVSDQVKSIEDGKLADVAPSILKMLELNQPDEMTGEPLF